MIRLKRVKEKLHNCEECFAKYGSIICFKIRKKSGVCRGDIIWKRFYTLDDIIELIEKKYGKDYLIGYLKQRKRK